MEPGAEGNRVEVAKGKQGAVEGINSKGFRKRHVQRFPVKQKGNKNNRKHDCIGANVKNRQKPCGSRNEKKIYKCKKSCCAGGRIAQLAFHGKIAQEGSGNQNKKLNQTCQKIHNRIPLYNKKKVFWKMPVLQEYEEKFRCACDDVRCEAR